MTRPLFRRLMATLIFLAAVAWGLWHFDIPQILWLQTPYICETKGYSYRYQDGVRLNEPIPDLIRFELTTFQYASRFKIEEDAIFKEHQNAKIVYNRAGSTAVEDLYLNDVTDPSTKERTQTSLVFNNISGDIRLMHHRWIPPNGWQNSDLYYFSGFCLKKSFD